jgi:hypothetical protein
MKRDPDRHPDFSFQLSAFSFQLSAFSLSLPAPGVTATSCTQATTPNVPKPPKRQPLLGQIYGFQMNR